MKTRTVIILLTLFYFELTFAQVKGRIFDVFGGVPGVEITIDGNIKAVADIDGYFSIKNLQAFESNICFNSYAPIAPVILQNFQISIPVRIELTAPYFKIFNKNMDDISEFELSGPESCYTAKPIYIDKRRLNENIVTITINGKQQQLDETKFKFVNGIVFINWNDIKN